MPHRMDTVVVKGGLPENPGDTQEIRIQFNSTSRRLQYNYDGGIFELPSADASTPIVAGGSTLTLTKAAHAGRTVALDTVTGTVVTLPAASGSGAVYRFLVTVLATSNSHIVKVANATDIIQGVVNTIDTDTAGTTTGFATAADSDTITLNRGTTGSVTRGEWLEIVDIASGVFAVRGQLSNTGAGATPFSATVA